MEKEFVPYELEVKLKKLGCDKEFSNGKYIGVLWQQAFDWFREKGFDNGVSIDGHKSYYFEIWHFESKSSCYGRGYINYKEARETCLEKLIELCQKESNYEKI